MEQTMPTTRNMLLVMTLTLLVAGCNTLSLFKSKDMQDSLDKTLHSYELTVRWGELSQIYLFLEPELAKQTVQQENLDGIRVTSYDVVRGPKRTGENQAIQSVRISYIYRDRQVEKTIIDNQIWAYNAEKNEWRRNNPIPKF
jgi:hypothetical protein